MMSLHQCGAVEYAGCGFLNHRRHIHMSHIAFRVEIVCRHIHKTQCLEYAVHPKRLH